MMKELFYIHFKRQIYKLKNNWYITSNLFYFKNTTFKIFLIFTLLEIIILAFFARIIKVIIIKSDSINKKKSFFF